MQTFYYARIANLYKRKLLCKHKTQKYIWTILTIEKQPKKIAPVKPELFAFINTNILTKDSEFRIIPYHPSAASSPLLSAPDV